MNCDKTYVGAARRFSVLFPLWESKELAQRASLHWIGKELSVNRQLKNEVFSEFLKIAMCYTSSDIRLRYFNLNIEIKKAAIDFERCFPSVPVAGGALRNSAAVSHTNFLRNALKNYSNRSHDAKLPEWNSLQGTAEVFLSCVEEMLHAGKRTGQKISSATLLTSSLDNGVIVFEEIFLRDFLQATSRLLQQVISSRHRFSDFSPKTKATMYNYATLNGEGFLYSVYDNCLKEVERLGGFPLQTSS